MRRDPELLLTLVCREEQQEGEGEGQMQAELSKLADDLVQKFEDQWKATAENLESASKAFDNLEGTARSWIVLTVHVFILPKPCLSLWCCSARHSMQALPLLAQLSAYRRVLLLLLHLYALGSQANCITLIVCLPPDLMDGKQGFDSSISGWAG